MNTEIQELFKKRFSFPYRYKHGIDLSWFKKYSVLIKEVYVNSDFMDANIPVQDMNGTIEGFDRDEVLRDLMEIQSYGIKITVIFNDIFNLPEKPTKEIRKAIDKYSSLIDCLVVPNEQWLVLKTTHPDIIFKNTVLNLPTAEEIAEGDYDMYDEIYIHDEIIHNHDLYFGMKDLRKFGTVVNFTDCSTGCEFKQEHYRLVKDNKYEGNTFCPSNKMTALENSLKRNCIPPLLSEYKYYLDVIDTYKLQGRGTTDNFQDCICIIENIYEGNEILTAGMRWMTTKMDEFNILKWSHKVRNCGGLCAKCSDCDIFLEKAEPEI